MAAPTARGLRIGLLSDTHGWLDPRIKGHFEFCDEVWHAGDIGGTAVTEELRSWAPERPLRIITGNIDDAAARATFAADLRFEVAGVRVWMTHIGGRPPRYDRAVAGELRRQPPKLFVCGHSHICLVRFDPDLDMLYMNPGACGRHGWHHIRTVLRFTIAAGGLHDLEVVELGPRAGAAGAG